MAGTNDPSKTAQESSLSGGIDMNHASNQQLPDKVDLNDLDWEDRERVLRLLFSKINQGVNAKTAAQKQNLKAQQQREEELRMVISEEENQQDYSAEEFAAAVEAQQ
jgi:hypothetical protein